MRVLVVGGDEAEKESIRTSLPESDAFTLSWTKTVEDGTAQLGNGQRPEIVLLDGKLLETEEEEDGLGKFISLQSAIPVIIFSIDHDEAAAINLIKAGAADVIPPRDLSTWRLRKTLLLTAERNVSQAGVFNQLAEFALAQMNDGVIALDQSDCVTFWSKGMETLFGIPEGEALGRTLDQVLPFTHSDRRVIKEAKLGNSVTGALHQVFVERRDAHMRFRLSYAPISSGNNNESRGLMCYVREAATTSDMQQLTGLLSQRLRMLADSMPGMVWMCDQKGERFLFNSKWLEFTGKELGEERGRGWLGNIERRETARVWKVCTEALLARKGYHVQYKLRRSDGQYRLIFESAVAQFSADGSFMGMMGSCNDISATRFTQPLPSLSLNFSSTLDHAPIAIWRLDRDLVIRKANPAVATMLHMDAQSILDKPFVNVVPSVPASTFASVLETGERVQLESCAVVVQSAKGPRKAVWDIVAWPLKDSEGTVIGVCMSSSEVSEKQRKSEQRDDFVAALVHDLKTPLIGADRTLEQMINGALGGLDPGQTEVLNMLRRSNHQLLLMVQNLIEVYRYEAGQPALTIERTDLGGLIRTAMSELKALSEHKGIKLSVNLPDPFAIVEGDRLALRRVFLNLMDNALKFTSRGGTLTVTSDETPDSVIVHVSDTGIGISQIEQGKLFQQFWQGETGKRYAPGTGLGLYLCKQIVTAHSGTISVHSEEGAGTTFSIRLPKAEKTRSSEIS